VSKLVVVVDDHPANLKLITFLLVKRGYAVRTAPDAASAIELVSTTSPSAIIVDLQLPDMDGLELTRRLKQRAELAGIPIIAVTAFAMSGDEDRARAAGCDGYVTKPIDTRSFVGVIESHMQDGAAQRGSPTT
jgi:two-component system cell cycle response regulator DivK